MQGWIHGYKFKDFWIQMGKCKDAWITKCKGFHGHKMQRFQGYGHGNKYICKDAQKKMQRKIHGYKNTQDFWIQMQRHMDAKCKYSWIRKCQDAWIQMQGIKDTKMQRC